MNKFLIIGIIIIILIIIFSILAILLINKNKSQNSQIIDISKPIVQSPSTVQSSSSINQPPQQIVQPQPIAQPPKTSLNLSGKWNLFDEKNVKVDPDDIIITLSSPDKGTITWGSDKANFTKVSSGTPEIWQADFLSTNLSVYSDSLMKIESWNWTFKKTS